MKPRWFDNRTVPDTELPAHDAGRMDLVPEFLRRGLQGEVRRTG